MAAQDLIVWPVIGAVAGWLAGIVMHGTGYGLIGDIVIGILAAFVAGFLFPRMGVNLGSGVVPAIIAAAIGAVILLSVAKMIRRAT